MSADAEQESEPIPIAEVGTAAERPIRATPPTLFVLHNTGDTDENAVHRYYSRGKIGPHAMINRDGVIRRYVPEDRIAAHAGYTAEQVRLYRSGDWRRYVRQGDAYVEQAGDYSGYETWNRRWPGLRSPLELTGEHPNRISIGVECLASHHVPPEMFTDGQYAALAAYIREQAARFIIPIMRERLLGHYDVNPLARSNRNGDTDPGERFNWRRLLLLCGAA